MVKNFLYLEEQEAINFFLKELMPPKDEYIYVKDGVYSEPFFDVHLDGDCIRFETEHPPIEFLESTGWNFNLDYEDIDEKVYGKAERWDGDVVITELTDGDWFELSYDEHNEMFVVAGEYFTYQHEALDHLLRFRERCR